MPKPGKFIYEKKIPFRDSFYLIIVCEGQNREPDYFRFFDGISSRVKVIPVESNGSGSPGKLTVYAMAKEQELGASPEIDQVWFVIDTDRWREQLHEIRKECETHPNWKVAQSNPCFEVWLYFHAKSTLPELPDGSQCKNWKRYLPIIIKGGFNPDFHPVAIEAAIINSKANYLGKGYFPNVGSTQLWQLGEQLLAVIKNELNALKGRFPTPEVID